MTATGTSNPFRAFVEKRLLHAFFKSGSNTILQQTLDVPSNADEATIRAAYKAISLRLHPDKIRQRFQRDVTPEETAQLLLAKEAYQILSDPDRRKIYRELGEQGLKMSEGNFSGMGGGQDIAFAFLKNFKANQTDKYTLVILLLLALADLIAAPILFCLKADSTSGYANTSWAIMWIPLWVIDFFLLVGSLSFFVASPPQGPPPHPANTNTNNPDTDSGRSDAFTFHARARDAAGGGNGAASKPELEEGGDDENARGMNSLLRVHDFEKDLLHRIADLISTVSLIVAQVALVMKLDGELESTKWAAVGLPWYIYQATVVWKLYFRSTHCPMPPQGLDEYHSHMRDASAEEDGTGSDAELLHPKLEAYYIHLEICSKARQQLYFRFFWIWQTVFFVLQLDGMVTWNAGMVLIPCWMYLAARLVASKIAYQEGCDAKAGLNMDLLRSGQDTDVVSHAKAAHGERLQGKAGLYACCTIMPLVIFVLLACALRGDDISVFWIFTPVWCALSIVLCLNCCIMCLCCTLNVDQLEQAMAAEMANQAELSKGQVFSESLEVPLASATPASPGTPSGRVNSAAFFYSPPAAAAVSGSGSGSSSGAEKRSGSVENLLDLPDPPASTSTAPSTAARPTPPVVKRMSDLD